MLYRIQYIISNYFLSQNGTGHNSVVNVPGTDDWYIIYIASTNTT